MGCFGVKSTSNGVVWGCFRAIWGSFTRVTGCLGRLEAPMNAFVNGFWQKVEKTGDSRGCWVWKGRLTRAGEPSYHFQQAHRVAFALFYGAVAPEMSIFHGCGNKKCVNPEHLVVGEPVLAVENTSASFAPPLSAIEILLIRALRKENTVPVRELAAQFQVSARVISQIANRAA